MHATRIYLVRHAKAEKEHTSGDVGRRLTADGQRRFRLLANAVRPRVSISRILTSPYVRAQETADILAGVTGARVEQDEALGSGCSSGAELLEHARRAGPGVALVGHNPEMADAIGLAAGRHDKIRPGTIAAVDLGKSGATVAWIETPPDE